MMFFLPVDLDEPDIKAPVNSDVVRLVQSTATPVDGPDRTSSDDDLLLAMELRPIANTADALSELLGKEADILDFHCVGPADVSFQAIVRSAVHFCGKSFSDVTHARCLD
jgi:hypothetical protein